MCPVGDVHHHMASYHNHCITDNLRTHSLACVSVDIHGRAFQGLCVAQADFLVYDFKSSTALSIGLQPSTAQHELSVTGHMQAVDHLCVPVPCCVVGACGAFAFQ